MGRKARAKQSRSHRQWNTAIQTPEEAARMAIYTRAVALKAPKGMCVGCAFRPGTEASRSSQNLLSIEACIAGICGTFTCHAGGVIDEDGFIVPGTGQGEPCRGYVALMETLDDMTFMRAISPPPTPRERTE